jgi:hypothetical protein
VHAIVENVGQGAMVKNWRRIWISVEISSSPIYFVSALGSGGLSRYCVIGRDISVPFGYGLVGKF